MRVDASNARTWLVAGVAGWSLLFVLLALAGLGSRLPVPDQARETAAPAPLAAAPSEAPALAEFSEVSARPLFTGDRRPHPFFIDPMGEGDSEETTGYVLTSVLMAPDFAMAIVQAEGGGEPVRLRVGDAPPQAPGWRLQSVEARSAVFETPEGPRTLELRVFDGIGGEAPTAVAAQQGGASAAASSAQRRSDAARTANETSQAAPDAAADDAGSDRPPRRLVPRRGATGSRQLQAGAGGGVPRAETAPANTPSPDQVEAIRKRIEERRARMRQQQQQSNPAKTQ